MTDEQPAFCPYEKSENNACKSNCGIAVPGETGDGYRCSEEIKAFAMASIANFLETHGAVISTSLAEIAAFCKQYGQALDMLSGVENEKSS